MVIKIERPLYWNNPSWHLHWWRRTWLVAWEKSTNARCRSMLICIAVRPSDCNVVDHAKKDTFPGPCTCTECNRVFVYLGSQFPLTKNHTEERAEMLPLLFAQNTIDLMEHGRHIGIKKICFGHCNNWSEYGILEHSDRILGKSIGCGSLSLRSGQLWFNVIWWGPRRIREDTGLREHNCIHDWAGNTSI